MDALQINAYFRSKGYPRVKRQKLLYYAQGWHLAWYGKPLFDDPLVAFEMGPVVQAVYWSDRDGGAEYQSAPLSGAVLEHVQAVDSYYGRFNGTQLAEMSHQEAPWLNAWQKRTPVFNPRPTIRRGQMFTHFSRPDVRGPVKPQAKRKPAPEDVFAAALDATQNNLQGVNRLLAER